MLLKQVNYLLVRGCQAGIILVIYFCVSDIKGHHISTASRGQIEASCAAEPNVMFLFACVIYNKQQQISFFASEILSSKTLPEPTKTEETVAWYPWTINNKYYTADVRLCVVPSTFQMSSEIAQSMQAFIAYFDSTVVRDLRMRYSLKISTVYPVVHVQRPSCVHGVCRRMVWKSYILGYQWWKILLQRCSFWCVTESVKMVSSPAVCG